MIPHGADLTVISEAVAGAIAAVLAGTSGKQGFPCRKALSEIVIKALSEQEDVLKSMQNTWSPRQEPKEIIIDTDIADIGMLVIHVYNIFQ